MVPTQATKMIPTYPVGALVMPSQFIPMNPVLLQQALAILVLAIIYLGYEPPKATFFEQKATTSAEAENNVASEIGQMNKTMSQITNELTHLRISQGQNNKFQRKIQALTTTTMVKTTTRISIEITIWEITT
jgi:hypothetical protein